MSSERASREARGALRTWRLFRPLGIRAATHAALRHLTMPLDRLLDLIPGNGDVLDVGCGHGLVSFALTDRNHPGSLTGVDVDQRKIAIARRVAQLGAGATQPAFSLVRPSWDDLHGSYDVVVVCDVLYLLGADRVRDALAQLDTLVASRGTLIIKEMSRGPGWKARIDHVQETMSVRVLGVTQGSDVAPVPVEAIGELLEASGWRIQLHRLDHGYPHPHAAVVAHRAADSVPRSSRYDR